MTQWEILFNTHISTDLNQSAGEGEDKHTEFILKFISIELLYILYIYIYIYMLIFFEKF